MTYPTQGTTTSSNILDLSGGIDYDDFLCMIHQQIAIDLGYGMDYEPEEYYEFTINYNFHEIV